MLRMDADNPIDGSLIAKALEELRARISRIENERGELDRLIAVAKEEERLLVRLLSLRKGEDGTESSVIEQVSKESRANDRPMNLGLPIDGKAPAVEAAVRELATAGRPVHISELMRLLREHKVPIPGAGAQANLIAHLRRDSRVVRPSRGMYGLAAWGLEDMPEGKPRRRRKRRMRAKESK